MQRLAGEQIRHADDGNQQRQRQQTKAGADHPKQKTFLQLQGRQQRRHLHRRMPQFLLQPPQQQCLHCSDHQQAVGEQGGKNMHQTWPGAGELPDVIRRHQRQCQREGGGQRQGKQQQRCRQLFAGDHQQQHDQPADHGGDGQKAEVLPGGCVDDQMQQHRLQQGGQQRQHQHPMTESNPVTQLVKHPAGLQQIKQRSQYGKQE